MDIYVGNLPYDTDDAAVKAAFEAFGAVDSVKMIIDHETGRSKGFGFVSMSNEEEAMNAIAGLNGSEINGREIKVNEARPKSDAPRGNGGGRQFGNSGGPRKGGFRGGDNRGFRNKERGDFRGKSQGRDNWGRSDGGARRSFGEGESDWR
ncbi:MAG: RNA-binding protein [Puniceicoccaceae bacterium]